MEITFGWPSFAPYTYMRQVLLDMLFFALLFAACLIV